MKVKYFWVFTALFFLSRISSAQFSRPGEIDTTFNFGVSFSPFRTSNIDAVVGIGIGNTGWISTMGIQADGKLIIAGQFQNYNGIQRRGIARLNLDGTLDATFNTTNTTTSEIRTLAIQQDGKIIIGGGFTSIDGVSRNKVARLNPNGTLDMSFNPGTGFVGNVTGLALQPDGKIVLTGTFTSFNGVARNTVVRLLNNGNLDTTFNAGTATHMQTYTVSLQADGKIIVSGIFKVWNGLPIRGVVRLNSDGTLDPSFSIGLGVPDSRAASTHLILPNGKILVGGDFITFNGFNRVGVVQLNSNGSVDTSFNSNLTATLDVRSIALEPSGKIVLGCWASSFPNNNRNVYQLHSNGTIDTTFSSATYTDGVKVVESVLIRTNGRIVVGGWFNEFGGMSRGRIAQLYNNGRIDLDFNPLVGSNGTIFTSVVQVDGKILVAGDFTEMNGMQLNRIARLNPDGTLDLSFNPGTGANGRINALAVLSNGKIIVGGQFTSYNGIERNGIFCIHGDGRLDTVFNLGSRLFSGANIRALALSFDEKIYVGGSYILLNSNKGNLIRIHSNGGLDTSFNVVVPTSPVYCLLIQPDGKLLSGGLSSAQKGIERWNPNGSVDSTFNVGLGVQGIERYVFSIAYQPDHKIILVGDISSFNNELHYGLLRLNPNGTIDTTFLTRNLVWDGMQYARSVVLQQDGKVIVVGRTLLRFNANGTKDSTFVTTQFSAGNNLGSTAYTAVYQQDGSVLIGGSIFKFNAVQRPGLGKVIAPACATPVTNTTSSLEMCSGETKMLQGTPGGTWIIAAGPGVILGSTYIASGGAGVVTVYNKVGNCTSPMITFLVKQAPNANIIQVGDTLKAENTSGSFQWMLDGQPIAGAISTTLIPRETGVYTLVVTNSSGCSNISNAIYVFFVSTPSQKMETHYSIYPVPFQNHLTISGELPFSYELFDVHGKPVLKGQTSEQEISLKTTHLIDGVYVVKIDINNQTYVRKVVKK